MKIPVVMWKDAAKRKINRRQYGPKFYDSNVFTFQANLSKRTNDC